MTHSTRRVFCQAIPLALLILGIGLARQYAAGAGLFEAGNSLVAKAQSMFAELRAEFVPSAEVEAESTLTQDTVIANSRESRLAKPAAPTFEPRRLPIRQFSFSGGSSGHCRH